MSRPSLILSDVEFRRFCTQDDAGAFLALQDGETYTIYFRHALTTFEGGIPISLNEELSPRLDAFAKLPEPFPGQTPEDKEKRAQDISTAILERMPNNWLFMTLLIPCGNLNNKHRATLDYGSRLLTNVKKTPDALAIMDDWVSAQLDDERDTPKIII